MHPTDLPKINWQPIAIAPTDGTVIMGYWSDDPDPRPQAVRYLNNTWFTPAGFEASDTMWIECTTPSHWSPITITSHE